MGSKVTDTIKSKIIVSSFYVDNPAELMFGMFTVLIGCGFWMILATLWSLPVSSTHTCIGGMIGMGIVSKGWSVINWSTVVNVVCSWFYTPVIAATISFSFFYLVRKYVLLTENPFERSLKFFSPMVATTLGLNLYVLISVCPWLPFTLPWYWTAVLSLVAAIVIAIFLRVLAVPCIRNRSIRAVEQASAPQEPLIENDIEKMSATTIDTQDVFAALKSDEKVAAIHDRAETYEPCAEHVFVNLQVLAAILSSFAHGANDVSHSIGPFAACIAIYQSGSVDTEGQSPAWVLLLGACGIIVGLATMGYRVMATVGVNLVTVTPCRGFFIELAASVVVIIGSGFGLPLSTTQCKIGAAVGVGLIGGKESVNWKLFMKIFGGWIGTIFISAIVSGLLMGYGIYAPHAS